MNSQPKEFKMTPQEYKEILVGVELKKVILRKCNFKYSAQINAKANLTSADIGGDIFSIKQLNDDEVELSRVYNIVIFIGKKKAVTVDAEYSLLFTCKQYSEEFFEIYASFNLDVTTRPYLRELIASLVSRAGLENITMPLLKQ